MKARLWELAGKIDAFMCRRYVITNGMILAVALVIVLQAAVMLLATKLYAGCILAR